MTFIKLASSTTFFFLFSSFITTAQISTSIIGQVKDSKTNDPIPFANVLVKGTKTGTLTDFDGHYKLDINAGDSVAVSFIGYAKSTKAFKKNVNVQFLNFELNPSSLELAEVVIHPGENPAWPILRNIILNKTKNDRRKLKAYQYKSYTRNEIDILNISDKLKNNPLTKRASRALEKSRRVEADSGKMVLPVFVSETVSDYYQDNTITKTKEVILKSKVTGVGVADNTVLNQLVGQSLLNPNFYSNTIGLLTKEFISPLSDSWRINYHYYLTDSIDLDGHFCYVIDFKPRNKQDLGFNGKMWIDKNTYALVQIDAVVSKDANINYIDRIKIQQEYFATPNIAWLPLSTRVLVEVNGLSGQSTGLIARTYTNNSKFKINEPMLAAFFDTPVETATDTKAEDEFWQNARPLPLTKSETEVYQLIDSLKEIPVIKGWVNTLDFLVGGYKSLGKFEFGPYFNSYAYNSFEGHRVHFGFRTNEKFSRFYNLKGYVAMGTKDPTPYKFNLDGSVIVSRKHFTEVGVKGGFDAEQLGISTEEISFNSNLGTSLFSAFSKFGHIDRPYYQTTFTPYLNTDIIAGLTQKISFSVRNFYPLFPFPRLAEHYIAADLQANYRTSEVIYEMRYSKSEFAQMNKRNMRIRLRKNKDFPIYTFRYVFGNKSFGSDFYYHKFSASISKTYRMGLWGNSNITLFGGYTPSTLPYPLLFMHQGNQSPIFIANAYNLMNYSEFASDRYVSVRWFHDFEGLFLNRIPLMRKLNWRCHVMGKALWGTLGPDNRKLLVDYYTPDGGRSNLSCLNTDIPYAEVGYGVDNIFKFLRIDFLHRLTYLSSNDPNGIRSFAVKASVSIKL